jgi:hypothetical protein
MHMKYFGDSYDIVKQSLIGWLGRFGKWSVHPMLTEGASKEDIDAFENFLGARVISKEVLTTTTNRETYFSCATQCGNLFLDPDTGLRLKNTKGKRAPEYLFASELDHVVSCRSAALTLVFDQSLPRGNERKALQHKLADLLRRGVHGFAYVSHASFLVTGRNEELIKRAFEHVRSQSRLPLGRFLPTTGD